MEEKLYTKEQLKAAYKFKIANQDDIAVKALIEIYNNQTFAEQEVQATQVDNGIGFTGTDAGYFSNLAKQYLEKGSLSPKQMAKVKKAMPKYAGQLLEARLAKGELFEKVGRKWKVRKH